MALVELRRGQSNKYTWTPFALNANFNDQWWDRPPYQDPDPWFVQAMLGDEEVARVELDDNVDFDHYRNTPNLSSRALEIQLIEVSAAHGCLRIGSEVVRRLVIQHRERTLVAFSEDADGFWSSLGWDRYDHPEGWPHYRPLFVEAGNAGRHRRV